MRRLTPTPVSGDGPEFYHKRVSGPLLGENAMATFTRLPPLSVSR